MPFKTCSNCQNEKDFAEFSKDKYSKDKLTSQCLICRRQSRRESYQKNRIAEILKSREHYNSNKQYYKEYYLSNKSNVKKRPYDEYNRQYYQDNKEKLVEMSREYRRIHKPELNEKSRQYKKKRRNTDTSYKILIRLRSRLYKAIRGQDKSATTRELIGCSIEDLLKHLESKFTEEMSWDKLSEIHIDHIRPCASFDLTDSKQQSECFNFMNLQPLWAKDNYKKGDKYAIY